MAEDKKGVLIYADWIKKFEVLQDEEAGKLIKHFFRYINDLNPIAPDRITELSFIDIENTLKRDLKKWEKRADRSRENGKKGGRPVEVENPKKPKETQQVILEPKKPDSVNVNVSVNDSVINKKGVFIYIGLEQIFKKPSEVLNERYQQWLEGRLASEFRNVDLPKVLGKFDQTASFNTFTTETHFKNTFQKICRDILNPQKSKFDKPETVSQMTIGSKSKMPVTPQNQ